MLFAGGAVLILGGLILAGLIIVGIVLLASKS